MTLNIRFLFVALCAAAVAACGSPTTEQSITITNGWVRPIMPGATMTASYLTITNGGNAAVTLNRVSSPQFNAIEIHETTLVDGTMKMRRVQALEIPAGASATLAPGGQHLMLMGPKQSLDEATPVTLLLEFSDGSRVDLTLPMQQDAAR